MDGYFYIIQLAPEALPGRVKFGYSKNPRSRLRMHRTAAPTATILGHWPCPRTEERRVIYHLTQGRCSHVAGEVYDTDDPIGLCELASASFPVWLQDGFPRVEVVRKHIEGELTFKDATDGIPADVLARALNVSPQTVRQYRLDPSSDGHRSPPAGWQATVARILHDMGAELQDRASLLMADQLDP